MPNPNYDESKVANDRSPAGAKELAKTQTVGGKDLKYGTPENLPATENIKMKEATGVEFKSLDQVIPDA